MKNKGIIAVNKPADWTSFDVVNKLKYQLKPLKVGHLGTLDPMATGVLLVTVGKATKLFDIMQEKSKTYVAEFEFGYTTDTLDSTGQLLEKTDKIPTKEQILTVLQHFVGKITQIPPKYSAKSINGKRAYDLARQNIDFELKPKIVQIYAIEMVSYENNILKLKICCGSGTYIRSIGRDIAKELCSLATMTKLVRTKIDNFDIDQCKTIDELVVNIQENIIPIKKILKYQVLDLNKQEIAKLLNGQILHLEFDDGIYSIQDENDTIAIVKITDFNAKMSLFLG